MVRRSKQQNPETIRSKLVLLLQHFEQELERDDLREKVLALVPAYHLLRDLGSSLIPEESISAQDRIIRYLCKYPRQIIHGDELMVVSGIGEWARRVRELRVEFGWNIANGLTAKEMAEEEELDLTLFGATKIGRDNYILLDHQQDREAALRWNIANKIRKKKNAVRDKVLEFLRANVGKSVTGEELRYVANDKTEWARRVRELRTEYGWPIITKTTGRPDLLIGAYLLEEDRQTPTHDRKIPDSVRREVLVRDKYTCQKCKWKHEMWNRSDPRHLELHHIHHHGKGGKNTRENLITLCTVCHDSMHRAAG